MKRMKYRCRGVHNLDIIIEVSEPPMGSGSGWIPPPLVAFFKDGREVEFVYQGDEEA